MASHKWDTDSLCIYFLSEIKTPSLTMLSFYVWRCLLTNLSVCTFYCKWVRLVAVQSWHLHPRATSQTFLITTIYIFSFCSSSKLIGGIECSLVCTANTVSFWQLLQRNSLCLNSVLAMKKLLFFPNAFCMFSVIHCVFYGGAVLLKLGRVKMYINISTNCLE